MTPDPSWEARLAELESRLAYLQDRSAISDLYQRYMRGFDRNDEELLRSAFWPDVQINYAEQVNTMDEFITRHLDLHVAELAAWGHLLTNETVEIAGDVAHVETYVTRLSVGRDGSALGADPLIIAGRYVDRLERRNGEWRILVREFVPHFGSEPGTAEQLLSRFSQEHVWDRADVSYTRPLPRRTTAG